AAFATDMTQTLPPKAAAQAANTAIDVDVQDQGGQSESDPFRRDRLFNGNKYNVDQKVNDSFSVNSSLRFEPAQTSLNGGEATRSQVYLDQMYVKYEWKSTAGLRMGKFENPRFGVANPSPREVGIFGHDSPLDAYESGRALGVNPY